MVTVLVSLVDKSFKFYYILCNAILTSVARQSISVKYRECSVKPRFKCNPQRLQEASYQYGTRQVPGGHEDATDRAPDSVSI